MIAYIQLDCVNGKWWTVREECVSCCRMKSLEEDAMRAQAVIAKTRELQDGAAHDHSGLATVNIDINGRYSPLLLPEISNYYIDISGQYSLTARNI